MDSDASKSGHEALRIQAVRACNILNTRPEAVYDRIVFTAAQLLRAPMAMLAIVGGDYLWLKARVGPLPYDWPRPRTFCDTVIRSDDALVVEDATADAQFSAFPCVVDRPFIRFYMGVPIHGPDRHVVATLCVLDSQSRRVSDRGAQQLRQLAYDAENLLTARSRGTVPAD